MIPKTSEEVIEICREVAETFKEIVEKEYYKLPETPAKYEQLLKKNILEDILRKMDCPAGEMYVRAGAYLLLHQHKFSVQYFLVSDLYRTFMKLEEDSYIETD